MCSSQSQRELKRGSGLALCWLPLSIHSDVQSIWLEIAPPNGQTLSSCSSLWWRKLLKQDTSFHQASLEKERKLFSWSSASVLCPRDSALFSCSWTRPLRHPQVQWLSPPRSSSLVVEECASGLSTLSCSPPDCCWAMCYSGASFSSSLFFFEVFYP